MIYNKKCLCNGFLNPFMKILDFEENYKIFTSDYKKSDTIVIDNGTYELKSGYLGSGCNIKFRNCFYKDTEGLKFENIRAKNKYTPFTYDMISGFHVLEENIDQALEYLKVTKCENLIITDSIFSPTRKELINFLFDVYHFDKIQVGVDAIYSYLYNYKLEYKPSIIISLGHSASYIYVIKDLKILDTFKLYYGGKFALLYITNIIKYKFKEYNKNYNNILKYLKCSLDYDKEVFEILEKLKIQDYNDSVSINGNDDEEEEDNVYKSRLVEKLKNINKRKKKTNDTNINKLTGEDTNINEILEDDNTNIVEILEDDNINNITNEDTNIIEKKNMPGMLKIRLYQYNNKIYKLLKRLENEIIKNEEEYEKLTDLPSFLNKKKKRYEQIVRELELREKSRKDSTNRKTYEFGLLLKTGELSPEELEYKNKLKECENTKIDENLIIEKDDLLELISLYDKNYKYSISTIFDIVTSKNIKNLLVNIDLLRVSEVLFEPSLVGSDQMGIGEILENILKQHKDMNEIFITGGFSQIEGFKERIEAECKKYAYHSDINIKMAKDPVNDAVNGAMFSDMFETYTFEEYKKGMYK